MPGMISGRVTRRDFLEHLGTVGGTAMLLAAMNAWDIPTASATNAPPDLRGSGEGKKIIILGAGHAGQTAAYELTKLGYSCVLLEARAFAGGRCQTARRGFTAQELGGESQTCHFDEGLYINHGPWRIPFSHRSTLHYTKEFKVPIEIMVNDNDAAYLYAENVKSGLSRKRVRQFEIKADIAGHTNELVAKAASTGKLDGLLVPEDKDIFVEYLVSEGYLSKKDLTYTGTDGRGYQVNPGAGVDPGEGVPLGPYGFSDVLQSGLWRSIRSVGGFDMQRTMFEPVGGMDQIAKAFEKRVGHLIRYHAEVQQIRQNGKGVTVNYLDTKTSKTASVSGDYCLCTIPLSVLKNIESDLSQPFKAAMAEVAYTAVGKIGLQMKRRFWEEDDFIYGGHVHTNLHGVATISLPSSGWQQQKGVLLGYYTVGPTAAEISAMTLAERVEFALAAGAKVFPQYRENFETAFSWSWHRSPYNQGGWAAWSGEGRKSAYPKLLEADGRVYLAGEHLSYLNGWQAGAIESAWQQIEKIHKRASV